LRPSASEDDGGSEGISAAEAGGWRLTEERRFTYDPTVFDVGSFSQAQWTILNPDAESSTEEKWGAETNLTIELIATWLPRMFKTCLDYGSGVGRLAKPLVELMCWSVIGADISASMRNYADAYVASPRYLTCRPELLDDHLVGYFDYAISVLALQHCKLPVVDIKRIVKALKPGGRLFVLNATQRFVPTREVPWVNDGLDIFGLLAERLTELRSDDCPWAKGHRWAVYERGAPEPF
jgi:SAM-dependent methyltransferase